MRFCRENPDIQKLEYPLYVMPKLNGIRCVVSRPPGEPQDMPAPLTNTLAIIPNLKVQNEFTGVEYEGLDGELIAGPSNAPNVFERTSRFVRAREASDKFMFFVFDYWDRPGKTPYKERLKELEFMVHQSKMHPQIALVPYVLAKGPVDIIDAYENLVKKWKYEGLILRNPNGLYKFGRTTMLENNSYKLKPTRSGEAIVIGIVEAMKNENELTVDPRGYAKRSKKKDKLTPKGTMGSLYVQDLRTKAKFHIGTGFSDKDREWWYLQQADSVPAFIVRYKFFEIGSQGAPLQPVYDGLRDKFDIAKE
jgi:DNA ligase-1